MTKVRSEIQRDVWGTQIYDMYRSWEVQRKPYTKALPYQYRQRWRSACYSTRVPFSDQNLGPDALSTTNCANNCYSKFKAQLGETSTWANNLLEARDSIDMIVSRATQLLKFTNSLRKGHFGAAANVLTGSKGPKKRRPLPVRERAKTPANTWLEYHFGWSPLIQDIHSAMETLTSTDFGGQKLQARCTEPFAIYNRVNSNGWVVQNQYGSLSVKMGAHALVSNPNAFLANQVGLLNPLSVAWEAVPFSFVVDWFTNVGDVLASMTDFVGVTLSNQYTTTFQRGTLDYVSLTITPPRFDHTSGESVYCGRVASISGPTLAVKPFKGFSVTRAATAISLLLQSLPKP